MRIFDEVLARVEEEILAHPPERGGLLFGPVGRDVITLFEPDEDARTSAVTYTISARMCAEAPRIERATGLEYKGVIHSHPRSMDHPSGGDRSSAANALRLNPHMGRFFMPIVTARGAAGGDEASHEIAIRSGVISGYVATRGDHHGTDADVSPTELFEVPLRKSLIAACARLVDRGPFKSATIEGAPKAIVHEGVLQLAYVLACDSLRFIVMASEFFPHAAPQIVRADDLGTRALPVVWSMDRDPGDRIAQSVAEMRHASRHEEFGKRWWKAQNKSWKRREKKLRKRGKNAKKKNKGGRK